MSSSRIVSVAVKPPAHCDFTDYLLLATPILLPLLMEAWHVIYATRRMRDRGNALVACKNWPDKPSLNTRPQGTLRG